MKLNCCRLFLLFLPLFSFTNLFSQSYCTPSAATCTGFAITSVKFGNIDNTSGCNLFSDYTTSVSAATVNAGTLVPLSISYSGGGWAGTGYVKGWIDFNHNGIFENSESFNIGSSSGKVTQRFLIRIPFDASGGTTRMRLRIVNKEYNSIDPCNNVGYGETEDYAIKIIASGKPTSSFCVYVNQSATGNNDGSSWQNALTSLTDAFGVVKANDTIKVAEGNYKPGYLLTSGVIYLGGYPSTGNPGDADRNFAKYQTVLSAQEMFGYQLADNTVLNGFIFDNLGAFYGFSAAIRLENANPLITNCVFRNNTDRVFYLYGASPVISNCFFTANQENNGNPGEFLITANSKLKLSNCVFDKNTSSGLMNVSNSSIDIRNCTFNDNKILSGPFGTNQPQAEIIASANSSVYVANTIFSDLWYLKYYFPFIRTTDLPDISCDSTSVSDVVNSITNYNQQGTNLIKTSNPKFRDEDNVTGPDSLYFTDDDGLQVLNPCSPAMNTGLNSAVEGKNDILGNPRITSSAVDIGAYEINSDPVTNSETVYVDAGARGLNDGSSWQNAFKDLQSALATCADTIKVAAGNYYPSATDLNAYFRLENNKVLLGGYPKTAAFGNELRDPVKNQTILSGQLPGGNQTFRQLLEASEVDSSAIIDGFIIENSDNGIYVTHGSTPIIRNCIFDSNLTAGIIEKLSKPVFTGCSFNANSKGLHIDNSAPRIEDCFFSRNAGSAITNTNQSEPVISNCNFRANKSSSDGGDIFNDNSSPRVINCNSDSAYATDRGGSVANFNNSKPVFIKCVFKNSHCPLVPSSSYAAVCYNNGSDPSFLSCSFIKSNGRAGAFYNLNSKVKLENCLAYGNSQLSSSGNAGVAFMSNSASVVDINNSDLLKSEGATCVILNGNNSTLNIKNSIFWANNFIYGIDSCQPEILNASSVTNISNSITRIYGTNGLNGNYVGVDPRFININDPKGKDSLYGTADDGLALCSCSPAINAGITTSNLESTDISGRPRTFNSKVDIGAYEYQSLSTDTSRTVYVSSMAHGANTGKDWQNAYTDLREALSNSCADTIKIAQGIYRPAVKDRDSSFVIDRKIFLEGGYPASGNPSEAERDPDSYPTILSGEIGDRNDSTDNSFVILKISTTDTVVQLDGIAFSDCYHNNIIKYGILDGGAVLSSYNRNLVVNNCRFKHNYSSLGAASLNSSYSNIHLSHTVFSNNYSYQGYTIYVERALVTNCVFANNYSALGQDVKITSNNDFKNCIFYNNFAGAGGAGIWNGGVCTIVNCDFINNSSKTNSYGAAIYNPKGKRAYLLNCILTGNDTGNGYYPDWYDGNGMGQTNYYYNGKYYDMIHTEYETYFPYHGSVTKPGTEQFANPSNPVGPDNKWFTSDDGLRLLPCSPLIDRGVSSEALVLESRNLVMPVTDIRDSNRVQGASIDVGAYEYTTYFKPTVNIEASDSVICAGTSVTFTASTTGGGSNPVFDWQLNGVHVGDSTNKYITSHLKNNDQVKVTVSGSDSCTGGTSATSNIITEEVHTAYTPSVSISTGDSTICQGTLATFIATPVYGGRNPVYHWQVNGINVGDSSSTFSTSSLSNKSTVRVILKSGLSCATPDPAVSQIVTMSVNNLPVADAGKDTSVCAGSNVQLNASGGISYKWSPESTLNDGAIAQPLATPSTTTTYFVTVSNAAHCFATDSVIIKVNQPDTPTVTIAAPEKGICLSNPTTFTASATYAGSEPIYKWEVNGIISEHNSKSFTVNELQNGDLVDAMLISSASCITTTYTPSNVITTEGQELDSPVVQTGEKILFVANMDTAVTYTWQVYTNNSWTNVLPIGIGPQLSITGNGTYRVMAEKGACVYYSKSHSIRTSLPSDSYGIYLYPNPADRIITLDSIKKADNWKTLEILNPQGTRVYAQSNINNQSTIVLDIGNLRKGIYFIKLEGSEGRFTVLKFVKL